MFNNVFLSGGPRSRPSFANPTRPEPTPATTFFATSSLPTTTLATTTTRISFNQIDDLTSPDYVDNSQELGLPYDPCSELNACGPNALCSADGTDPVCSCPIGFSGIPRNGLPDPSHGCVRTPQKVLMI